jgi:DNA polymerase-1
METKKNASKCVVSDIEGNNLLYRITKMHCGVILNPFTLEEKVYGPTKCAEYLQELSTKDEIIGHNFSGFDLHALHKLFGFTYDGFCFDTLVLSRLLNPERFTHALEGWGHQLKFHKGDYARAFIAKRAAEGLPYRDGDEWLEFSQDMLDYCVQDVRLNAVLFLYFIIRLGWFSLYGVTKAECLRLDRAIREGDLKRIQ